MKKLLLPALLCLVLFSCKKNDIVTVAPNPAASWIAGKWKLTIGYNDTVINRYLVDDNLYHDELNFITDHQVTSKGTNATFTYSLSTMIMYKGNMMFTMKKLSDNNFALVASVPYYRYENFVKE